MSSEAEASTINPYSMTEEILKERQNSQNFGHLCPQIYAGVLACLSSLSFGTTLGWSHPISQNMKYKQEDIADNRITLLLSIALLGCSFGVTLCSFLQQLGPKKALRGLGPFYILTWWLMLIPSISVQLAGRFFLGFLGVSYSTLGENLLLQTVHYGIRRYICVVLNATMVLGILTSQIVGVVTTKFWMTVCFACIPILHYILIQVVPESPVFLYATSHIAAAKSLEWYRGEGNFHADMANIKKDWDASRQDSDAYGYMLFNKVVYRGLLIVTGVTFFQISAGYFIFLFYEIEVWSRTPPTFSPVIDTTVGATCFVLSKLLWGTLHTGWLSKIRPWLISSCFFTAVSLTSIAIYLILDDFHTGYTTCLKWTPMLSMAVFLLFFDMGLNHFPKILIFEYMPFQMYRRAYSVVQALHWLFAFLNIYSFATTYLKVKTYVIFIILASITYVGSLFCYLFVVEPRGKSLVQVQLELGGNPVGKRGALYNQTKHTL